MSSAISMANKALDLGEPPFGAVVIDQGGQLVASMHDQVNTNADMTAHAETLVIRSASKASGQDLSGHTLYTTCEPCPMCYTAAWLAHIERIVYATTMEQVYGILGPGQRELRIPVTSMNNNDEPIMLEQGVLEEECLKLFRCYASRVDKAKEIVE